MKWSLKSTKSTCSASSLSVMMEQASTGHSCFKNSFLPLLLNLSALIVRFTLQAAACEGCPNQSICASAGPAAPDPDVELIARNLDGVKNIVLVLSGKVNGYFKI